MMEIGREESKIDGSSTPASMTRSICPIRDGEPDTHEQQSLSAVKQLLETTEADLLIEGTLFLQVDVSIERAHCYKREEATGEPRCVLGKGWLVSLSLPAVQPSRETLFHLAMGKRSCSAICITLEKKELFRWKMCYEL